MMKSKAVTGNCSFAKGFTFIELSVVLAIIGLIIGGALVGEDLLHAAQLRATISQYESFVEATRTFQGKYNCLPGDCATATNFFPGAINGNGNNVIDWTGEAVADAPNLFSEGQQFFYQLAQAQMIPGSYSTGTYVGPFPVIGTDIPASPLGYGGGWGIGAGTIYGQYSNYLYLAGNVGPGSPPVDEPFLGQFYGNGKCIGIGGIALFLLDDGLLLRQS
jgi:prepilin-type N-terminal cleavage/methylation domain-containing protein